MTETIIKVENLGKKYLIRHEQRERYVALRDVIANKAKRLWKNVNSSTSQQLTGSTTKEDFWALKDVSFEIKQGDRVGIIGRNGAGKTTLLKLLSRITEPTTGRITLKGRVASLLEVGTGFHPELTGRENIFLNGAILGMSKVEIKKKFDEIVDFAEIEKFLDTPVKRYSSGMYVRLAFSVAAHLDPDILLIDEVLAVGDIAFQRKCFSKMENVSENLGRTILFVSHNMGVVRRLCSTGIYFEHGEIISNGRINVVVEDYLKKISTNMQRDIVRKGNGKIIFEDYLITDEQERMRAIFYMGDNILVYFKLHFKEKVNSPIIAIHIKSILNEYFAHVINLDDEFDIVKPNNHDNVKIKVKIQNVLLTPGKYLIELWAGENTNITCDYLIDCLSFEIIQGDILKRPTLYPENMKVFLHSEWQIVN